MSAAERGGCSWSKPDVHSRGGIAADAGDVMWMECGDVCPCRSGDICKVTEIKSSQVKSSQVEGGSGSMGGIKKGKHRRGKQKNSAQRQAMARALKTTGRGRPAAEHEASGTADSNTARDGVSLPHLHCVQHGPYHSHLSHLGKRDAAPTGDPAAGLDSPARQHLGRSPILPLYSLVPNGSVFSPYFYTSLILDAAGTSHLLVHRGHVDQHLDPPTCK